MSTLASPIPPTPSPEPVFRLSVQQYHAMIATGVLTDDDPVELLEGLLVFKMPKNPPHIYVVTAVDDAIAQLLPAGWHCRRQDPITLDDGEPEPDGAVVRGTPRDYVHRRVDPRNVGLVIEVADTTLARDRGIKLRSYARAEIPVFWIVNLIDRTVEVYTRPDPRAAQPAYLDKSIVAESASVDVVLEGKTIGTIQVRDLLP